MCRIVEEYGKEREAFGRAEGLKRGLKTGMQRGVHETAIANAKNLLRMNLGTLEQISQVVSLPLEQVLSLKEELEHEEAVVSN
ncbi:MAG: hypothetical protein SPL22_10570 [Treponema sp.]|uniref:hypothetical protein n=1 Tax=Treponema sp. TaxID=166 RepID=UPI002A9198CC|nr:hypothetical protein [Treponema sp.]MDY6398160.1 hypothetical protein [Treponema sp.]